MALNWNKITWRIELGMRSPCWLCPWTTLLLGNRKIKSEANRSPLSYSYNMQTTISEDLCSQRKKCKLNHILRAMWTLLTASVITFRFLEWKSYKTSWSFGSIGNMETNQWQAREMRQCRECHLEVSQQSFQAMEIKLINKLKTVTDQ